ncbi:MAG: biotin/lipoyl-binding protein [Dialister invisus]
MAGAEQEIGHHCRGFGDRLLRDISFIRAGMRNRKTDPLRKCRYSSDFFAFNSNGRIEEMLKEEGDAVKAGDVLARLDTRPLELAIAQRRR